MHRHLKISLLCFFGFTVISGLLNLLILYVFGNTVIIYVPSPVINLLDRTGFKATTIQQHYNDLLLHHDIVGNVSLNKYNMNENDSEDFNSQNESLLTEITERKALIQHDICKGNTISLVILIFSNPSNINRRNVIRETWLTDVKFLIRHTFVVAKGTSLKDQKELQEESDVHKDILQFDFIDSYKNLTYKTVSSFKWVIKACPYAAYVLKIDDDMWLNKKALSSVLERGSLKGALGGSCLRGAIPIRDPHSKYFIPKHIYPYPQYPPFCSGTAYVADIKVIEDIAYISKSVPYFPLEDIYVALCMKRLNRKVVNLYGFNSVHVRANPCWLKSSWLITTHEFAPYELRKIWKAQCDGVKEMKSNLQPDLGGSLAFKQQQLKKLNVQRVFQQNAQRMMEGIGRGRINKKEQILFFN